VFAITHDSMAAIAGTGSARSRRLALRAKSLPPIFSSWRLRRVKRCFLAASRCQTLFFVFDRHRGGGFAVSSGFAVSNVVFCLSIGTSPARSVRVMSAGAHASLMISGISSDRAGEAAAIVMKLPGKLRSQKQSSSPRSRARLAAFRPVDQAIRQRACDLWLREFLPGDRRSTGEVFEAAGAACPSKDQVRRATYRIGAIARKIGLDKNGQWCGQLPAGESSQ
jgi:hypothetical protein